MKLTDYLNGKDGHRLLLIYGGGLTILAVLVCFVRAAWTARDHMPEGYAAVLLLILGALCGTDVLKSRSMDTPSLQKPDDSP